MRGRDGIEQNLSKEKGPLSKPPFPPKNVPRDGVRWKKRKKLLSILSKDIFFLFTPRGRLTGRQVGVWTEGGRELKEEGRLFQTQKQIKGVFWQNRLWDVMHIICSAHIRSHAPSNKHKALLARAKIPLYHQIQQFKTLFLSVSIFPILTCFIIFCLVTFCFVLLSTCT